MATQIEKIDSVMKRTSLGRSTIYLYISQGKFPAQIILGSRSVGWLSSSIDDWIAERVEESRARRAK